MVQDLTSMLAPLWAPTRAKRPRRQGGWRQQLEEPDSEGEANAGQVSRLFGKLLLQWCDGTLAASMLQPHASDGIRDGFSHPMASRIAALGQGQHAHDGLMGLLRSCDIPLADLALAWRSSDRHVDPIDMDQDYAHVSSRV